MKLSKKHPHVYKFLMKNNMSVLSTVSEDGKPWGSAIYTVVDEDFNFYFVTRIKTYKYINLDKNNNVALTIADESSQTTVQLAGKISKVPPEDYVDIVFTRIAGIRPKNDFDWAPPVEKVYKGNYMPLKITPTKMQYANFKEFKHDIKADYIETII